MSNHLKRLNMPKTWKIRRKEFKFIISPNPGKDLQLSMPLLVILRDLLEVVHTAKECRFVINNGKILINQVKAKNPDQSMGVFDSLSFGEENYRLLINEKNHLFLKEISGDEAKQLFTKIIGKKILKKGIVQLNLLNGYNILVKKDDYTVGDTVGLTLPKMIINSKKQLIKGGKALLYRGKHAGISGVVENIFEGGITLKSGKKTISTLKDYAIAI